MEFVIDIGSVQTVIPSNHQLYPDGIPVMLCEDAVTTVQPSANGRDTDTIHVPIAAFQKYPSLAVSTITGC